MDGKTDGLRKQNKPNQKNKRTKPTKQTQTNPSFLALLNFLIPDHTSIESIVYSGFPF